MGRKRGIQYRLGSFYRSDDRSGFVQRAENTQQEWNGLIVAQNLWEIRQPQDLVKGIPDDQRVPNARPLPPAIFDGPIYIQLSAAAAIGATFIDLQYIAGLTAGDNVGIMLNTGTWFNTTINGAPTSSGVNITDALPAPASSGNLFVDYLAAGP